MNLGANPLQVGFVPPLSYGGVNVTADGATASRTLGEYFSDMPSVFNWDLDAAGTDTERHTAVQAAVTHCYNSGQDLYWPGDDTYVIDGNISNFHDIKHIGNAKIQRGSDVWYITPKGDEENIIYIAPTYTVGSDGFDLARGVSPSFAFSIMRTIKEKSGDGVWRVQFPDDTITHSGTTLEGLPAFKNKLRIWGYDGNGNTDDSGFDTVPGALWDLAGSIASYGMRADNIYATNKKNFHFRNIKFINAPFGNIVVWYGGIDVLAENLHSDESPRGFWYRGGYVRHTHGKIENASSFGISAVENITYNFGDTTGGGTEFVNVNRPYYIGRNCSGHIDGAVAGAGITDAFISVEWLGRAACQGCDFSALNVPIMEGNGNCVTDVHYGTPNTYPTFDDTYSPVLGLLGTVDPNIASIGMEHKHRSSNGDIVSVSGTTAQKLLSDESDANVTNGSGEFVPFRLPAYFLYNQAAELRLLIECGLAAGHSGGVLALHGAGSSGTVKLSEITIPAGPRVTGYIEMRIFKVKGSAIVRYECTDIANSAYKRGSSSLASVLIRDNSADTLSYRLYWTPLSTDSATFYNLQTYVTA